MLFLISDTVSWSDEAEPPRDGLLSDNRTTLSGENGPAGHWHPAPSHRGHLLEKMLAEGAEHREEHLPPCNTLMSACTVRAALHLCVDANCIQ